MKKQFNRRSFHAVAAASTLSLASQTRAAAPSPSRQIAFLADTHISADANTVARGVKMADHLERVVGQVVDAMPSGSHVIINGDCAYLSGLAGDYTTFAKLVAPLADADLKLHLTMGNHDDRGPMYRALNAQKENDVAVADKHVDVIKMPDADIVLLDSLWKVNQVTGMIGPEQLAWLKAFLDSDSNRPVLVVGHHNMQFNAPAEGKPFSGVRDTSALATCLHQHPRVKAYFYGHTHHWTNQMLPSDESPEASSLHLVNQPPVSYVFDAKQPSGWVLGTFTDSMLNLKISTLDTSHPANGEEVGVALVD